MITATDKLLFRVGNLGQRPFGVKVTEPFASWEVHGPFNTPLEAWNYAATLRAVKPLNDYEVVEITSETLERL